METLEQLRERMEGHAKANGFALNPNPRKVNALLRALLENKREYGELYCPCRRVTGDKRRDSKIVCPCAYHKREIKRQGHCLCGLFVK
ncbi:ferredoxin:thioredoxin reductase [Candidatus Woesearchaeota archaeon]|nr:ferredoxin:thioredoxin reductase [Candidatus Woesearchaeota archaeon]